MNLYETTCQDVSSYISMGAALDNSGTIDTPRHLSRCVMQSIVSLAARLRVGAGGGNTIVEAAGEL